MTPPYYGFGVLAVDNYVYQYLSTYHGMAYWGRRAKNAAIVMPELKCSKLIYSTDHGRTWCNQDGTPAGAFFEQPKDQSRKSMIFWDEPRGLLNRVLLQMGKGYSDNRDGYVYGYSMAEGGSAAELGMFRVPRAGVLDKKQYEYFCGRQPNGDARWGGDINAWASVHRFASDWTCSSIVHHASLGLYMMAANYLRVIDDVTDTVELGRLGLWVAQQPWGPWEQVCEESPWTPAGGKYVYAPSISPNWISENGKSFWMTWSDWSKTGEISSEEGYSEMWYASIEEKYRDKAHEVFMAHSNFRFNRQRVDLVIA